MNGITASYPVDGRSTGYGISTYGTANTLTIGFPNGQATSWLSNSIYYREGVGSFFKSLSCQYQLYSTNENGDKIYGEYVGNTKGTDFGHPVTKDGITTLSWTNTVNQNFGAPIYKLDPAEGFIKGRRIYQDILVTATFFNGTTQTWMAKNSMILNNVSLDYNDVQISICGKSTVEEYWHGNNTKIYDELGSLGVVYMGYADATNITALYTFDTSTATGVTPSLKVVSTRFSLPKGQTTDVAVTLINQDGIKAGPYIVKNVSSVADDRGGYISANKVAKDNGLNGTYYLKSLRYLIPKLRGTGTGLYLYGYGQQENPLYAGTFIGTITKNATSTLQLFKPDGSLIVSRACNTSVKSNNITNSAWISSVKFNGATTVTAGTNLMWDLNLYGSERPYGTTSHIRKPVLYLRLPQGITITDCSFSKTAGGDKMADAEISIIKQESVDGIVYRFWKIIPNVDLNYGGYFSADDRQYVDNNRWLRIKMTTDPDMEQTSIVLKENIGLLLDGHSGNDLREWDKNYLADKYDLNNNGDRKEIVGTIQDQTLTFKVLPKGN